MKLEDFEKGDCVVYIPTGETGVVKDKNQFFVFVIYNGAMAQATLPEDLIKRERG